MKNMKWRNIGKKTPKKLRILGNTLLSLAPIVSGLQLMAFPHINKWIPIISGILMIAGKFLTMFFAEEEKETKEEQQ
jgi:hypothetical protein